MHLSHIESSFTLETCYCSSYFNFQTNLQLINSIVNKLNEMRIYIYTNKTFYFYKTYFVQEFIYKICLWNIKHSA